MVNKINWHDASTIARLAKSLRAGHVVVGTTDTVLGLLAPTTSQGFLALNAIKKRELKPYLVLADTIETAKKLIAPPLSPQLKKIIDAAWPGPVTLIVRAASHVPPYICSPEGTIALRVPNHDGLRALCARTGPLFSTSANQAGLPIPHTSAEIDPFIMERVAYLVENCENCENRDNSENCQSSESGGSSENGQNDGNGGSSQTHKAPAASTILDCTTGTITVVRQGAFDLNKLREILNETGD